MTLVPMNCCCQRVEGLGSFDFSSMFTKKWTLFTLRVTAVLESDTLRRHQTASLLGSSPLLVLRRKFSSLDNKEETGWLERTELGGLTPALIHL